MLFPRRYTYAQERSFDVAQQAAKSKEQPQAEDIQDFRKRAEKLKIMKDTGLISEEEFAKIKQQTLSELDKDSMTQSANKPLSAEEINVSALLERIFLFLEDGNWKMADKYCERVLDLDPRNAQAYLGKMMAERHVYTKELLVDCEETFWGDRNFSKALRFGNKEFSSELMEINSQICDRGVLLNS